MHWENLPKVTHNEDAMREYERAESKRIGKWLKMPALFILPLVLLILWILSRQAKSLIAPAFSIPELG